MCSMRPTTRGYRGDIEAALDLQKAERELHQAVIKTLAVRTAREDAERRATAQNNYLQAVRKAAETAAKKVGTTAAAECFIAAHAEEVGKSKLSDEMLFFHLGRGRAQSYWDMCRSCLFILDFINHSTTNLEDGPKYPLMSHISEKGLPINRGTSGGDTRGSSGTEVGLRVRAWWKNTETKYKQIKALFKDAGYPFEDFDVFKRKCIKGLMIVDMFAKLLMEIVPAADMHVKLIVKNIKYLDHRLASEARGDLTQQNLNRMFTDEKFIAAIKSSTLLGQPVDPITLRKPRAQKGKRKRVHDNVPRKDKSRGGSNDDNIPTRPKAAAGVRRKQRDGSQQEPVGMLVGDGTSKFPLIFSGKTKPFRLDRKLHPRIIVEVFRDEDGNVCNGTTHIGKKGEEVRLEPGDPAYLNDTNPPNGIGITDVHICDTSDCYFYAFPHAEKCPHWNACPDEATEYGTKVFNADRRIAINTTVDNYFHKGPKEEASNNVITMITDRWNGFKQFFDFDRIHFPMDIVMEYFDWYEESKQDDRDEHKRGFACLYDGGLGRTGVHRSAWVSQEEGGDDVVMSPPTMTGDIQFRTACGQCVNMLEVAAELMDAMYLCGDSYIRDENGLRNMSNDPQRDEYFGKKLRERTGCKQSKFEAFTLIRQYVGKAEDLKKGGSSEGFRNTKRHRDINNCHRSNWNYTYVSSFLVEHEGNVYRLTLILYTRSSCGDWLDKNIISRHVRQALKDHELCFHGGLTYRDLFLREEMGGLDGYSVRRVKQSPRSWYDVFKPKAGQLRPALYNRHEGAKQLWEEWEGHYVDLSWTEWVGSNEIVLPRPLKVIIVREFANRCGYVSSYAYQLCRFNIVHKATKEQRIQLLYAALVCPSQAQFYSVMEYFLDGNYCRNLRDGLDEVQPYTYSAETNMFLEFRTMSIALGFESFNGGPFPRVQPQPLTNLSNDTINESCDELAKAVELLEDGQFNDDNGNYVHNHVCDLKIHGVKHVGSISFPQLCLFTGLVKSQQAVQTARQTPPNMNSAHTYMKGMKEYVRKHCNEPTYNPTKEAVTRMMKAIGVDNNETQATVENAFCGRWRSNKTKEIYIHGQSLFEVTIHSSKVQIQTFGSGEWVDGDLEWDEQNKMGTWKNFGVRAEV